MKALLATLALALFAGTGSADTIWTYEGNSINNYSQNPFAQPSANPCNCDLDATVTIASDGFTVLNWSFTDGIHTLTDLNSTLGGMLGLAEPNPLLAWDFLVSGNGIFIITRNSGSVTDALDAVSASNNVFLSVGSNAGTWTESAVATPEPGTLALLGIGLVGLLSRKRKKPAKTTQPSKLNSSLRVFRAR